MKAYVNHDDPRWKKFKIDFEKIAAAAYVGKSKKAEASITLTDDPTIQKLNRKYRGLDRPTNVLSFEIGDDEILGDIFVSFDTVLREAGGDAKKFIDHAAHMVVHGVLHLQGYDHLKNADADRMESMEIAVLKKLGMENPYD